MSLRWPGMSGLLPGAALLLGMAAATLAAAQSAPPQFVAPEDGATVTSPLVIRFRLADADPGAGAMKGMPGMASEPHVHLIIDSPPPEPGATVPADLRHRHMLHGERQTTLVLKQGDHTLQLVIASASHRVGTPPVASPRITVHVVAKSAGGSGEEVKVGYAIEQDRSPGGSADPGTFRRARHGARL